MKPERKRHLLLDDAFVKMQTNVGTELERYRLLSGYTKTDVAKKIGVTPATIYKIEKGQAVPTCDLIEKYMEALDLNDREERWIVLLYVSAKIAQSRVPFKYQVKVEIYDGEDDA